MRPIREHFLIDVAPHLGLLLLVVAEKRSEGSRVVATPIEIRLCPAGVLWRRTSLDPSSLQAALICGLHGDAVASARVLSFLWAVAVGAVAAHGHSLPEAPRTTIEWTAPSECADSTALRVEIERLLGGSLDAAAERPLAARALVSREKGRWQLQLELSQDGVSRRRLLEGESCRALLDAAAVVIALAINPALDRSAPERTGFATQASEPNLATESGEAQLDGPPHAHPVRASRTPELEHRKSTVLRPSLGVFTLADGWMLPRFAGGVGLRGAVALGTWRVGLVATLLGAPPARVREGADMHLWSAGAHLNAAYLLTVESWTIAPCVAFGADFIRGSTDGLTQDGSGGQTWWTAGPGLAAMLALGRTISLESGAILLLPLKSDVFQIERDGVTGSAHEAPDATLRAHFGFDLQFR